MSLANANGYHQQKSRVFYWIFFRKAARCHARGRQSAVRPVELEVREFAVLVALRNARRCQQGLAARLDATVTTGYTAVDTASNRLPSRSLAQRTYLCGSFHRLNTFGVYGYPLIQTLTLLSLGSW